MVAWPGPSGITWAGRGDSAGFATPVAPAAGNQLPGITGAIDRPAAPGPGGAAGGQLGGTGDGRYGTDPRTERMQPWPWSSRTTAWGEGDVGAAVGLNDDAHQSFRRYGVMGFNDKLTVRDRHGYWDAGNQKTGTDRVPHGNPNSYNDPVTQPPRPDFRLINRTVSYQQGTDATRNQDDLARNYSWLGEQGSGWAPVYGGVPGLYHPYGSRGGYPYPVVSPAEQGAPGDGPHLVFAGPPHGLHSQTPWKGGAQIIARFSSIPQTRPVRQDRPANSPQAGQTYSQTVLPQGATRVRPAPVQPGTVNPAAAAWLGGRGWGGRTIPSPGGANWLGRRNQ